jgi:hypothetical protein
MNRLQTEREIGLFIRRKLNATTAELDAKLTDRLFLARQAALAVQPAIASRRVASHVGSGLLAWSTENFRPFAVATVLVLTLMSGNYMMSAQHISEMEEIDSALLADDLPINAYLDSGFGSWLADSSQP